MTNWITRFNVSNHSQKHDAIQIVSKNVSHSAQELGFQEINFGNYYQLDDRNRRKNIIDTVLGPVQPGDLIVIQFPLWTYLNFQSEFIDQAKSIDRVRVVALVHDIPTWMFDDGTAQYDRENDFWLKQLRKFDLLLVANEKGAKRLREDGVMVPLIAMHIWDYYYDGPLKDKKFKKQLFYVGGRDVNGIDYHASTPLMIYNRHVEEKVLWNPSVDWLGRLPSDDIVASVDGGFGLVVSDNIKEKSNMNFVDYTQYNNPTKLSLYLAAGLPVIISSKTAHAKWIEERGIGLVVDNLNEIDNVLSSVTDVDYQLMLKKIEPWQKAVSEGFFIKRTLIAMLRYMELGFEDILIDNNNY